MRPRHQAEQYTPILNIQKCRNRRKQPLDYGNSELKATVFTNKENFHENSQAGTERGSIRDEVNTIDPEQLQCMV